ncbi:YeeE/YedE thiosulfate transporter family protein, partial [Klebsiella quasipneumoniae]
QRMAEYLVLYNSKRPHKSLELMTPVDYILRESKNCNMWWTHTLPTANGILRSVVGGTLMGIGIALIPGGNDGLILAAVPTLSPGGIVAYLLMTTTIVFGFAARGKLFRRCLSRP